MDDKYEEFLKDMEEAGIEVDTSYHRESYYRGPTVLTEEDWPTLQDVIRATLVPLQWDDLGGNYIVYPR